MNRNVFANNDAVANNDAAAIFFSKAHALRQPADGGAFENMIILADNRPFFDGDARFENCAVPNFNAVFDDAERPNLNVLTNFRVWIDQS